jgi:hypothetical protein
MQELHSLGWNPPQKGSHPAHTKKGSTGGNAGNGAKPVHMGEEIPMPTGTLLKGHAAKMVVTVCNAILRSKVVVINSAAPPQSAPGQPNADLPSNNSLVSLGPEGQGVIQVDIAGLATSGHGAELQTNGVDNAVQTLLNLVAGDNIVLTLETQTVNGQQVQTGAVRVDANPSAAGNYRADYDPSATYYAGDIVRSAASNPPGVYGVISTNPVSGLLPVEDNTKRFQLICYLPAAMQLCVSGASKTVIYNGLAPS